MEGIAISKAIAGLAVLGAAAVAGAFTLGVGGVALEALFNSAAFISQAIVAVAVTGISMEAGAIADALTGNRGMNITTRQTAAARQIIYGQQRVGGVEVYRSTTGSHYDQFNYVIVLAGHPCDSIVNLYLDGRQVYWKPGYGNTTRNSFNFGGTCDSSDHYGPNGAKYNFGGGVYCEARYGDQAVGDVIGGLTANDPKWAAGSTGSPYLGGCTYVYLKIEYNTTNFPGEPEIRFTVNGKNNIFDPRTGSNGFTANWALVMADVITDIQFGLGDNTVNQAQLIAAANVCDEQVAIGIGGTESRYTTNYHYDTTTSPGNAMTAMMDGAAGRLSRIGGEWFIWPAYWQGPSFTFDHNSLIGEVQWEPYRSFRDLVNRVTGTYVAPNYPYNVAGNRYDSNGFYNGFIQNNFSFAFQPTNFPQYAKDIAHGYPADEYLNADGGQPLPLELGLTTVMSITQAQRVAKIKLERNRQQGTGTLPMSLAALSMQPSDVMQFSFPMMGWNNKLLEVVGYTFSIKESGGGQDQTQNVTCNLMVQETASSVYDWSVNEEQTIYNVLAVPLQSSYAPLPPTNMSLISGANTAIIGTDGVVLPRIEVTWDTPFDAYVTQIQIQYKLSSATSWFSAFSVDVSLNQAFINGVVAGKVYDVEIRSVRPNGVTSVWEEVVNYTVSATISNIDSIALSPNSPYNAANNATIDSIAENGAATIRVYGPGGDGNAFNHVVGNTTFSIPGAHLTGLAFSTQYYIIYQIYYYSPLQPALGGLIYYSTNYNDTLSDQVIYLGTTLTCAATYTGSGGGTGGGDTGGGGGGRQIYYQ